MQQIITITKNKEQQQQQQQQHQQQHQQHQHQQHQHQQQHHQLLQQQQIQRDLLVEKLFKKVLKNKYLFKYIGYWIRNDHNSSIGGKKQQILYKYYRYDEIDSVEWLFEKGYIELFKDKFKRDHTQLNFTLKSFEMIFSILGDKEIQLIKSIYLNYGPLINQCNHNIIIENSIKLACKNNDNNYNKETSTFKIIEFLYESKFNFTLNSLTITANSGYFKLLKYLISIIQVECSNKVADFASRSSNNSNCGINNTIDMLNYLYGIGLKCNSNSPMIINNACLNGNMKLLEWFTINHSELIGTSNAIDWASKSGHLNLIKYCLDQRTERPSNKAIGLASKGGHFEVLKYLHYKGYPSHSNAITCAAELGNLPIVKFLLENRSEPLEFNILNNVYINGHLEVLEYLSNNIPTYYKVSSAALETTCSKGHLNIIKYHHQFRGEANQTFTSQCMDEASRNGKLEIVEYLHNNRNEGCSTKAMDEASRNGHLNIVEFLHLNRTEGCTTKAMDEASRNGHFKIVEFLLLNRTEGTRSAIDLAALSGHLQIIELLYNHYPESCSFEALNNACKSGHLSIVKFLLSTPFSIKVNDIFTALQQSIIHSNLSITKYILNYITINKYNLNFDSISNFDWILFITKHQQFEFLKLYINHQINNGSGNNGIDNYNFNESIQNSILSNNLQIFKYLMEISNGNIDFKSLLNESTLKIIFENGYLLIIRYLNEKTNNHMVQHQILESFLLGEFGEKNNLFVRGYFSTLIYLYRNFSNNQLIQELIKNWIKKSFLKINDTGIEELINYFLKIK